MEVNVQFSQSFLKPCQQKKWGTASPLSSRKRSPGTSLNLCWHPWKLKEKVATLILARGERSGSHQPSVILTTLYFIRCQCTEFIFILSICIYWVSRMEHIYYIIPLVNAFYILLTPSLRTVMNIFSLSSFTVFLLLLWKSGLSHLNPIFCFDQYGYFRILSPLFCGDSAIYQKPIVYKVCFFLSFLSLIY